MSGRDVRYPFGRPGEPGFDLEGWSRFIYSPGAMSEIERAGRGETLEQRITAALVDYHEGRVPAVERLVQLLHDALIVVSPVVDGPA